MNSIFSRVMAVVALTMSLSFAAGTANATTYTLSSWSCSAGQCGTGFFSTVVTGGFTDFFNFTLPGSASGTGESNATVIDLTGPDVNITSFNLFESISSTTYTGSITGGGTGANLTFAGGTVPGLYQLQVVGTGSGFYSGSIAAAVPEPETYAMLLAGLGLLGFSARRRKNV